MFVTAATLNATKQKLQQLGTEWLQNNTSELNNLESDRRKKGKKKIHTVHCGDRTVSLIDSQVITFICFLLIYY